MSDEEHPIKQKITHITVSDGDNGAEAYHVGFNGVTHIEPCKKPGEYAYIPYVRVWKGDVCIAEFCQHRIVGVYFSAAKE